MKFDIGIDDCKFFLMMVVIIIIIIILMLMSRGMDYSGINNNNSYELFCLELRGL